MPDYYGLLHVAQKLGLTEAEIAKLESQSLLSPVSKNGRKFYPAKQVHRLKAALRVARESHTSLEEAYAKLEARHPSRPFAPVA